MFPAMLTSKVVPIVLRHHGDRVEVLVFEHPQAGTQLVKGTVEAGESVAAAAVRELAEESGLANAVYRRDLGVWDEGPPDQVWHFCEMAIARALPDAWDHVTADDGGHRFAFWWHPLAEAPPPSCHALFVDALAYLRARVSSHRTHVEARMKQPSLSTSRLILRPYQLADASEVRRIAGAPEVAETTLNIPHPYDDGMAEAWIATHRAAWENETAVTFAITTAEHALCGTVSLQLTRAHQRGELG